MQRSGVAPAAASAAQCAPTIGGREQQVHSDSVALRRALAAGQRLDALRAGQRIIEACTDIVRNIREQRAHRAASQSVLTRLLTTTSASDRNDSHVVQHYLVIAEHVAGQLRALRPTAYEHQSLLAGAEPAAAAAEQYRAVASPLSAPIPWRRGATVAAHTASEAKLNDVSALLNVVAECVERADPLISALHTNIASGVDVNVTAAERAVRAYHDRYVPIADAHSSAGVLTRCAQRTCWWSSSSSSSNCHMTCADECRCALALLACALVALLVYGTSNAAANTSLSRL